MFGGVIGLAAAQFGQPNVTADRPTVNADRPTPSTKKRFSPFPAQLRWTLALNLLGHGATADGHLGEAHHARLVALDERADYHIEDGSGWNTARSGECRIRTVGRRLVGPRSNWSL